MERRRQVHGMKSKVNDSLIMLLESRLDSLNNVDQLPQREREKNVAYLQFMCKQLRAVHRKIATSWFVPVAINSLSFMKDNSEGPTLDHAITCHVVHHPLRNTCLIFRLKVLHQERESLKEIHNKWSKAESQI